MPSIYDLPTELVGLIAQQCDSEDLFNLRQTCRWVNNQTSCIFVKTYFATRAVMLQRQSLEVLLQISRHPIFGPAVTNLVVSMQHFLDDGEIDYLIDTDQIMTSEENSRDIERALRRIRRGENSDNGSDESDESHNESHDLLRNQPDKEVYHRGFHDQTTLQQLGLDAAYLVSIMGYLPNCTSLEIGGDDCAWGSTLVERSCGVPLTWCTEAEADHTSTIFITRAFQLIMGAVCISNMQIQTLCVTIGDVTDAMLALPGLDKTMLRTRIRTISYLELDELRFGDSNIEIPHLAGFLSLFSSLRHFVLKIANDIFGARTSRFFSNAIEIPTLEKLSLSGGCWTESALNQLLLRHQATLKVVHLGTMDLIGEDSNWLSILRGIKAIPSIHHIAVKYCKCHGRPLRFEDLPEEMRDEIEFVGRPKNRLDSFI